MADEHNKKVAGRIKQSVPKYRRAPASLPSLPDDRHAAERKMLEEVLGGKRRAMPSGHGHHDRGHGHGHKHAKAAKPGAKPLAIGGKPSGRRNSHGSAPSGTKDTGDLITTMAARLAKLEKARYLHRDEMVRKDKEILKLKRRIMALESATEGKESTVDAIENLRNENMSLKAQVHEMETFLNDYGLVWVGNSGSGGGKKGSSPSEGKRGPSGAGGAGAGGRSTFSYDIDLLLERVKSLNASAGEGKMKVENIRGAHKFVPPESVKVTLYQNGIFLKRGPFRSFETKEARQFVRDILDGYFPSEFKDHYPNGVVLAVTDRSVEQYDAGSFQAFGGKGRAVGEEASGPKVHSLADVGGGNLQLGKKDFLAALPASVLKGGKVIPVRKGIEDMLGGKAKESSSAAPSGVVLVNTPVVQALNDDDESKAVTPADVATLRVKSDTGKQTLVIKLRYDDTIADLRKAVDEHRTSSTPYELRTTFPRKAYTDLTQTLRDAGLIPNATLVVSPVEA